MPIQISAATKANYNKFIDFAKTHNGDTVARFKGMPVGDYKGMFAPFARTADMKTANDRVRNLFLKTIADMFGGANLTNKTREAFIQLVFIFNSTWALRMDALMAMDDILGTKFNTNPVYTDSIPESDFKDVYDVVEKYLREAHPESLV